MRLHLHNDVDSGHYAETLLKIDEGRLDTGAEGYILLSREFCILVENDVDLIAQVYPDLKQNLNSDYWLCARAILTQRNDIVSAILEQRNYIVNSISNDILKIMK